MFVIFFLPPALRKRQSTFLIFDFGYKRVYLSLGQADRALSDSIHGATSIPAVSKYMRNLLKYVNILTRII